MKTGAQTVVGVPAQLVNQRTDMRSVLLYVPGTFEGV
jgi:hypothetical protein